MNKYTHILTIMSINTEKLTTQEGKKGKVEEKIKEQRIRKANMLEENKQKKRKKKRLKLTLPVLSEK